MREARFLSIAEDWGVKDILIESACFDDGVKFQDVDRFDRVDWQATSLVLARLIKERDQLGEEKHKHLQSNYDEMVDRYIALIRVIEVLGGSK